MQKRRFKKTSINIEINLYMMSVSEGIELTAFVNRCLALFFKVPEDPHDKLIKEMSEYSVLRLREKYLKEISETLKNHAAENGIESAAQEKENELIQLGNSLQNIVSFPVYRKCLERRDIDDDLLRQITLEFNKITRSENDPYELWNRSLLWYQKYGKVGQ